MKEIYCPVKGGTIFLRRSGINKNRKTLLFIHGLGDSGIAWKEVFERDGFKNFNLIVPDLPGYGRSSQFNDYSFENFTEILIEVLNNPDNFSGVIPQSLIIIAHSMGGIPGVIMADRMGKRLEKLVLVEGSITQYGSFVSAKVEEVAKKKSFDDWFERVYVNRFVFEDFIKRFPVCRRYYASLQFCRKRAFMENSLEIGRLRKALKGEKWTHKIGKMYENLTLPKVYVYGDKSLHEKSIEFLKEKNLETKVINTACHFVMLDKPDEFYSILHEYVRSD